MYPLYSSIHVRSTLASLLSHASFAKSRCIRLYPHNKNVPKISSCTQICIVHSTWASLLEHASFAKSQVYIYMFTHCESTPTFPVLISWNLMKSAEKCLFFQDTNVHQFVLKNFSTFDVLDMSAPAVIHVICACSYVILAHIWFLLIRYSCSYVILAHMLFLIITYVLL